MPESVQTLIRSLLAPPLLAPLLVVVCIGAIAQRLIGARARQLQWAYQTFSNAFLSVAGGPLLVAGSDHIKPGQSYIVVVNHESNLDPFALMAALPMLCLRFVIKRQLMQVPVFGPALRLTGNVTVDRRHGRGDVLRLQEGLSALEPGVSLLFFAEGTRSRDGRFRAFKKGAFASAIASDLPILPIALAGTYRCMPPARFVLRRTAIAVEVGAPVETASLDHAKRDQLRDEVHAIVSELRQRARARVRAAGFEPGGHD